MGIPLERMISLTKQRSRRLRKKLRIGEFQEFGFEVSFTFRAGLDEDRLMHFWDAFILDAIERNALAYGGGTNGFVSSWARGSVTEAHREMVGSWLKSRAEVQSVDVGPLVDSWHADEGENAL
jgi:uncharacterized protein